MRRRLPACDSPRAGRIPTGQRAPTVERHRIPAGRAHPGGDSAAGALQQARRRSRAPRLATRAGLREARGGATATLRFWRDASGRSKFRVVRKRGTSRRATAAARIAECDSGSGSTASWSQSHDYQAEATSRTGHRHHRRVERHRARHRPAAARQGAAVGWPPATSPLRDEALRSGATADAHPRRGRRLGPRDLDVAAAAVAAFGRIDTWVNNAAVAVYGR